IERLGEDPRFPPEDYPALAAEGVRSALAVPLLRGATAQGSLLVAWRRDIPITADTRNLVESLAHHAAVALESARLLAEMRARADEALRLARALMATGDAVMVTDREGRIVFVNPAAERLTGRSGEALAGAPAQSLLGDGSPPDL